MRERFPYIRGRRRQITRRRREGDFTFAKDIPGKLRDSLGENKVMPDSIPDDEHPLAPLRHAVALRINLLKIDRVTRAEKRLHRVTNMQPAIVRQQAFDILHDEPFGPDAFEQPDVVTNQRIARVFARLHPSAAKSLTRRATQQNVEFTRAETDFVQQQLRPEVANIRYFTRFFGKVAPIGLHRIAVDVRCKSDIETRLLEP